MQENQSIAISCRGVQKHFGNGTRVQALRGVDFEARLGELTFIVGPSGCGKTTLLSVITGLLDPSDGEVNCSGAALAVCQPTSGSCFAVKTSASFSSNSICCRR